MASRLATASTLPIMIDSTEPPVIQAGLEQLGGRSIVNSVNFEDGDGPDSRYMRIMALVKEHGAAVVALTSACVWTSSPSATWTRAASCSWPTELAGSRTATW